jgi:hypothetical protein
MACDAPGRELVVTRPLTCPVPPVAGLPNGEPVEFVLTVSYVPDSAATVLAGRAGVCGEDSAGAVRRSDEPEVRWRRPTEVREGLDVKLATAKIKDCILVEGPQDVRRRLEPTVRPRVVTGRTGRLPAAAWSLWPGSGTAALGVQATISTIDGAFRETPIYTARVEGTRNVPSDNAVVDGFVSIEDPTERSFRLIVSLPQVQGSALNSPQQLRRTAQVGSYLRNKLDWGVVWMGVEA